jgi:ABC-type multidrug transport system permease subunit
VEGNKKEFVDENADIRKILREQTVAVAVVQSEVDALKAAALLHQKVIIIIIIIVILILIIIIIITITITTTIITIIIRSGEKN